MNTTHTFSTALHCTIAEPALLSLDGAPLSHLSTGTPVTLKTTIVFGDQNNGEFAKLLMPDTLSVRVTFYAKPNNPEREIELGHVSFNTLPNVLTYPVTLVLNDPAAANLSVHCSYQIGAIVRVGTDPFSIPSLIRGFVEGPALHGDGSEAKAHPQPEPGGDLTIVPTAKASRRKGTVLEKSAKK